MTDLNRASVYVPITSITKADGGRTRIVTGVAASERLDMDGQRADYEWAKAAASDWFKRWGNVREQHGGVAAGKAISVQFDDQARAITVVSKAVDPGTITKLDEGVLTGYSWGAKSVPGNPIKVVKEADGFERVKGGAWAELSYVDHPCNYDCTIAITKAASSGRMRATKVLGELKPEDVGDDIERLVKATGLTRERVEWFIGKSQVSTKDQREGAQHKLRDSAGEVKFPINDCADVADAWGLRGNSSIPRDRVEAYIRRSAADLNCEVPGGKTTMSDFVKAHRCTCCDDCGPDCAGDCCDDCTMGPQKAAAPGPVGILAGIGKLLAEEPDDEYRGFLGKVATAVEGWTLAEGVSVDVGTYAQLADLSKAASEPDLGKRRTFYSGQNRAAVEQAMQRLHQELGLFMEGATSLDADQDQRDSTLTGQDAPAAGDQPGGPGTAPGDGNPGDGNLAYDPQMVRDGDPAIRTPDGERDGQAQGEAGTHTRPPAGDAPGSGPGDQGKGQAPPAKGREPDPQQAQQRPNKAAKRLRKLEAELLELRKVAGQPNGQPAIALQQHLGAAPKAKDATKALRAELRKTTAAVQALVAKPATDQTRPADTEAAVQALLRKSEKRMRRILREQAAAGAAPAQDEAVKGLREEIKELGTELHKSLEGQRAAAGSEEASAAARRLEKRLSKRLRRMRERLDKAASATPPANPLEAQIAELRAVIAGQATKGAAPDTQNSDATLLLMADLTRAAFDQARKDSTEHATWLGKRVKRAERRLRKAAAAPQARLDKMASDLEALGRLPHPGGPHVARASEKTLAINDSIERTVPADALKKAETFGKMAESSDRVVAEWARDQLKSLEAELRG